MAGLLDGPGFLGTTAPFRSDVALILTLLSALLFTLGWRLALRKRFIAHGRVQTASVVLNAIVVLATMIGSFVIYILPGIPGKLAEGSYGITTVHALTGTAGLLMGVFVTLRGNGLVPKPLRF